MQLAAPSRQAFPKRHTPQSHSYKTALEHIVSPRPVPPAIAAVFQMSLIFWRGLLLSRPDYVGLNLRDVSLALFALVLGN